MSKMWKRLGAGLGLMVALATGPVLAQTTQCVTNALAGGTADALTVPLLPCGLSTNILLLTLTATNATTSPTLQMAGFPALPIYTADGSAVAVGALSSGSVVQLTGTGTSWRLLTNGQVISVPVTVPQGGTGDTSLTAHGVLLGAGTSPVMVTSVGATGTVLAGNTGADPTWQALTGLGVTSLSFGSTGLTPSTTTQGAITVAGTLGVGNGGTGATSITGMVKGNGSSAFTAGTAGTDYVAPGTATTFTAKQTFNGSSSVAAATLKNATEPATISATAATGTINYDVTTQSVLYYTSNASANWTVNFRGSSGTTLNSLLATGDVVTVVFEVTQGATPFYNSAVNVDGTTSGVTTVWQGGSAPGAGNASSVDVYTYAIEKTGSATFTVFASQTQFK